VKNLFKGIGNFTRSKFVIVLILAVLLLVAAVAGASQTEMETGIKTFISPDDPIYQDFDRFNENFGSDVIMVMIEGEGLTQILTPENVAAMESVEDRMGQTDNVLSAASPAIMVKQAIDQQTGEPGIPDDTQSIVDIFIDPQTGRIGEQFRQVLPDEKHALVVIVLEGVLDPDDQKVIVKETESAVEDAGFKGVDVVVTGDPAVSVVIEDLLGNTRNMMLGMAVLLLFVILSIIFKVRGSFAWRWLPLGVVLIAMIYMAGTMGVTDISMTMMTMACFPILIGLGIDYGIQFHNRYDEESTRGRRAREAIVEAVGHIGPAVGIALIAGCLGFSALLFSPIPMIQDFGLTLIVGVIAAYIVAIFPLMAILYWRDRRKNGKTQTSDKQSEKKVQSESIGFVERALRRMAPWVIRNPYIIVPIALILTIGGLAVDSRIATVTDDSIFVSQDIPEIKSFRTLEEVAGGVMSFNILVENDDITHPATLDWMVELEQRILAEYPEDISSVESVAKLVMQSNEGEIPQDSEEVKNILNELPGSMRGNLISQDYKAANVIATIMPIDDDRMEKLNDQLALTIGEPLQDTEVVLTGFPVIRIKLVDAVTSGRNQMTVIGILFIFAALLLLFRLKILRAIMATLPIVLIIGWAGLFMYVYGIEFTPATATFGALIMGIGVEYTILLMSRYYEERGHGSNPYEAMIIAMTKIGRAVSVSAFTTVGGFSALLIAQDFPVLIDFGIVTMTNVFFALVASLLVLPTIIVWIDSHMENSRVARFL